MPDISFLSPVNNVEPFSAKCNERGVRFRPSWLPVIRPLIIFLQHSQEKFVNTPIASRYTLLRLVAAALFIIQSSHAQGSAGADGTIEPRYLIDLPTAGMLPHRNVALDLDFYQDGGLLVSTSVGLFDRLLLGISYGGAGIVGNTSPVWNNVPGFSLKARIIEESVALPAIALGFESQGKETYIERLDRYTIKSLGFYAVASKNYQAMGYLSLHGGVNYSLERADGDSDPNFFVGAEKTLGPIISVLAEYNLGLNDSNKDALGRGRGYLNAGIRASLGSGFTIGFNLKDIVRNQQTTSIGNRTLKCEFVHSI